MQPPQHILTQLGILTSFSVAKKVTESDINAFFRKNKKRGKSDEEISKLLHEKIFNEIRDALTKQKIPGLVGSLDAISPQVEESIAKNLAELNRMIMVIARKLTDKKYDKLSLCYFINSLVNLLGLSEKDFETFHQKMSGQEDDDDDDDEEEA